MPENPTLYERYERFANPWAVSFLLLFIVTIVFWETQYYGFFVADDDAYVVDNPIVRQGLTAENAATVFSRFEISNYHPLTMVSLMLDTSAFGSSAAVHHRVNLLIHAVNTLLLFWILWAATRALWPSAAVALLFGVHPLHVEPVVWISSRKDVLSTLFMLAAVACYVRYVKTRSILMYLCVCAAFVLALLSKQMPVTLPFVLLLFDYWPLNRIRFERSELPALGKLIIEKAPLFALSAVFSIVIVLAQQSGGSLLSVEAVSLADRLKNTPLAYVMYLAQTIAPLRLQAIGYRIPRELPLWQALAALVVLTAITLACIRYIRKWPFLAVGWFMFLGTFVPVIGLVTLGSTYRADRYTYVPLIGLFIALVWGVYTLLKSRRLERARPAALALAGVLMFVYTAWGWNQVGMWRDNETILNRVLELDSGHHLAKASLADYYRENGELLKATEIYLDLARTSPAGFGYANHRLGKMQFEAGNYQRAEFFYEQAYKFEPDDARTIIGLSRTKAMLGKFDEAEAVLVEAIDYGHPESPVFQMQLERVRALAAQ